MTVSVDPDSIFGRIVTGGDVEAFVLDCLRLWSSTYLSELERQHGLDVGDLPRVRSWRTAPSLDKWPEDQLPSVVVQSLGTSEAPRRDGASVFRVRWQMNLAVVCSARMEAEARALGFVYLAAHRTLLLQRPSLDGNAAGVVWQDEDYSQLAFDDQRTLAAPQAAFTVEVSDVVTQGAGPVTPDDPLDPDTDPWPPWPRVQLVDVIVDRKET